jgi:hypothetical protein
MTSLVTCTVYIYNIYSQSLNTSSLVTIDPPSALSPRVLNALKADPRTVDLRALAPHFYNLGARILELFEEEEMIEVLSDVSWILNRYNGIMLTRTVVQGQGCSDS